ncbi:TRAP transporter small permease [soil metagenome]
MQRVSAFLDKIESYICRTLLAVFVTMLFAQIVSRQVFGQSISWIEELAVYMFVWFVFFGASYAARLNAHNRVTIHLKYFLGERAKYVEAFADLLWVSFNVYFIYLSVDFLVNRIPTFWRSQTLGIEMKYIYMILPVAFTLMTIRILQVNYGRLVRGVDPSDPEAIDLTEAPAAHPEGAGRRPSSGAR